MSTIIINIEPYCENINFNDYTESEYDTIKCKQLDGIKQFLKFLIPFYDKFSKYLVTDNDIQVKYVQNDMNILYETGSEISHTVFNTSKFNEFIKNFNHILNDQYEKIKNTKYIEFMRLYVNLCQCIFDNFNCGFTLNKSTEILKYVNVDNARFDNIYKKFLLTTEVIKYDYIAIYKNYKDGDIICTVGDDINTMDILYNDKDNKLIKIYHID
uniref:Uncharacterized protein n=1 Tax=Pithovirus LCPAC102 TaxID=2506587 RepID=A0A481Z489_9VIRU|nr:MAG: hypothetical protein LCPAC102_01140 [Pithovirus LCPAC102]